MTREEMAAYAAEQVANWAPPTQEERADLAVLLSPVAITPTPTKSVTTLPRIPAQRRAAA